MRGGIHAGGCEQKTSYVPVSKKGIAMTQPRSTPEPIGLKPSFGFGDRIGIATPGHIAALRRAGLDDAVAPVFAQQSIRELTRTNRTPEAVLAAARRAVESAGWNRPWGADADHLKTEDDVHRTVRAGYTFFTADPSDFIEHHAEPIDGSALGPTFDAVCGNAQADPGAFVDRYVSRPHDIGPETLRIEPAQAMRIAITYLPAIGRVIEIYGWIDQRWTSDTPFDFEVSVDETEAPTSPAAHFIIATELRRAGVRITSLAPRFVGDFEKAVDYRGNLEAFERDLLRHGAIARTLGPYKLSIHSGSDKFSIYPLLARHAGDLLHLKTAGTSYLEALRLVARHKPERFRAMIDLALARFAQARATYHLSTDLDRVPDPAEVDDANLEVAYLDPGSADDARQILHVAFGAILRHETFGSAITALADEHPDEHVDDLVKHFQKHLVAFDG